MTERISVEPFWKNGETRLEGAENRLTTRSAATEAQRRGRSAGAGSQIKQPRRVRLEALRQVSPGWACMYEAYAELWLNLPLRVRWALASAFVLLALLHAGGARAQGAPNILTGPQVAAFEGLVSAAKKVDPTFLQSLATDAQKRAELSPLGAVSANLSAGAGLTLSSAGGFDQVAPTFRLGVGVDLTRLAGSVTGANAAQLSALTASTSAAGRELRVRVLQAFVSYLSAVRAAGVAADSVEVARATLAQAQARASVGASTGVDVLRAAQAKNAADADLYDVNLRLAVAKQQLSAITGLTLAGLDAVLVGAKPRP